MSGHGNAHADATRLIEDVAAHNAPQQVITDMGRVMAQGWNDPAYAQAFGRQFSTADAATLQQLGLPSPDQIFGKNVGESLPVKIGNEGWTVTHGAAADGNPVAILHEGENNKPGNVVTYVDNTGRAQSFEQTPDGKVVVTTNGTKKTYDGATLEVDPNTYEPIVHQGDAKTTLDKDGNEITELHGNKITRDKNGTVTGWQDGSGNSAVTDGRGHWSIHHGDGSTTPIDIPPGGQFNVGPDGRPGFTLPGKQNGGITAEVDPATGKVDRYSYPDSSCFYYDKQHDRWMHHDQHDQGADKDKWVTVPNFSANPQGIYTNTWSEMDSQQKNQMTA